MLNTCRFRCFPKKDAVVQGSWGFIQIILTTTIFQALSLVRTCADKSNNYTTESRYLKYLKPLVSMQCLGTHTPFLLPAGTVLCCNVRNTTGPFPKGIFSLLAYYISCSTESQQDFLVSSCFKYILTVIILYKSTTKCWTVRSLIHLRIWESQLLSQAAVTLGLGEKNSLTMWDHHRAVFVWIFRQSQERQSL